MSHNYGYCNSTKESREFLKMFRELMKHGSVWCRYTPTAQHIPNDLIYLTKDGVHTVGESPMSAGQLTNYANKSPLANYGHGRVVMTDQQMAEAGLYYDALRQGIVKVDPVQIVRELPADTLHGLRAEALILDDPALPGRKKAKVKAPKKDYNTVGVRFLRGPSLHKVYTYLVPKRAKLHLGQELVVPTPYGNSTAVVVELHKTPQDTGPYQYKYVVGTVKPL